MSDDKEQKVSPLPVVISAVGELIKATSDNPSVKAAGGEFGKSVLTVAKAINVVLLPLAALNFAYDKARLYFEEQFPADFEAKLAGVPSDEIIEPKPSLAGPILQGLAFTHDEPTLKEMYLNLLSSAMKKKQAGDAHPAFAEVIKQLSAEEARILCTAICGLQPRPIVQIRLQDSPLLGLQAKWYFLQNHLFDTHDPVSRLPIEIPNLPAMVDNWIRLGLLDVSYRETVATDGLEHLYDWVEDRPEVRRWKAQYENPAISNPNVPRPPAPSVVAQRGRFRPTAFGILFSKAVEMDQILRELTQNAPGQ